jgi:hypothetical protein
LDGSSQSFKLEEQMRNFKKPREANAAPSAKILAEKDRMGGR